MARAPGWLVMGLKKSVFGETHSTEFEIGDIVEWTTWDTESEEWKLNYGVLVSVQNEIRSNRMLSISRVMPLQDSNNELEFFTLSLRRISRSEEPENDT